MNIQLQAFQYLDHIFRNTSVGVKALLVDPITLQNISVAMTKTELFKNEVVLIEEIAQRVHKPADPHIASLSCYCILRPTQENVELLCEELKKPSFMKYHIFFTNSVTDSQLHQIAANDIQSRIDNFQEIYIDFAAIGTRLFSLNIPDISGFRMNPSLNDSSDKIIDGLFAAICSLRLKPIIRYEKSSPVASTIASGLSQTVSANYDLFSGSADNGLILILDRRSDPVTPLLHFFYFLSSVHDLFTINNNIVKVDKEEYIIDERNDADCEKIDTMYLEDAGQAIHDKMELITRQRREIVDPQNADMAQKALAAMKNSVQSTYALTYHDLYGALHSKIVKEGLLDITAFEQIVAHVDDPVEQCNQFCQLIQNPNTSKGNALRIALVYALHYESKQNEISRLLSALESRGPWQHQEMLYAQTLITIAGQDKRSGDLFSNKSFMSKFKKGIKNLQNDRSEFELFHPHLESILQDLKAHKLDQGLYPYAKGSKSGDPSKVIVFVVGGATYMEHVIATNMSKQSQMQIVLGGTTIHNAESFMRYEIHPFV